MSYPPPYGAAPPPYTQPGWQAPPQPYPYQPSDYGQPQQPPMPIYVPGTMMIPVPVMPQPPQPPQMPQMPQMPQPLQQDPGQPTYVTNYYYGETPQTEQVQISESCGDYEWVPSTATTAPSLSGRAVVGGREGWDGSPLWVIRAWHNGDLIPGKLSVRHMSACIMYSGKEISIQNIEVLCAKPDQLRWVPAANGNVPPGAIAGGRTASGETLYVGRVRHQLSLTPGKVHRSHNSCYIAFGGAEIAYKKYDVLCRIS